MNYNNNTIQLMFFIKELKEKLNISTLNKFKIITYNISPTNKTLIINLNNKEYKVDINNFKNLNLNLIDRYLNIELEYIEVSKNLELLKEIIDDMLKEISKELNDSFLREIQQEEIINNIINDKELILDNYDKIYKIILKTLMVLDTKNIDKLTEIFSQNLLYIFDGKRKSDYKLTQYMLSKINKNNINKPLYTIFLDLNNFKLINDVYNHEVGDKFLKFFASELKKILKNNKDSLIIRKGGDEFVIITDKENTEKILEIITNPKFIKNLSKKLLEFSNTTKNLFTPSASFGIGIIKGFEGKDVTQAITIADQDSGDTKDIFKYIFPITNPKIKEITRGNNSTYEDYKKAKKNLNYKLKKGCIAPKTIEIINKHFGFKTNKLPKQEII